MVFDPVWGNCLVHVVDTFPNVFLLFIYFLFCFMSYVYIHFSYLRLKLKCDMLLDSRCKKSCSRLCVSVSGPVQRTLDLNVVFCVVPGQRRQVEERGYGQAYTVHGYVWGRSCVEHDLRFEIEVIY